MSTNKIPKAQDKLGLWYHIQVFYYGVVGIIKYILKLW